MMILCFDWVFRFRETWLIELCGCLIDQNLLSVNFTFINFYDIFVKNGMDRQGSE